MREQLTALERRLASLDPAQQPDAWAIAAYRVAVALTETPSDSPRAAAERALTLLDRAGKLLDVDRAPLEHARIVNAMGAVWRSVGDRRRTIEAFSRAVGLMQDRARPVETGAALSNLGLAHVENGDTRSAIETFDRALAALRPHAMEAMQATTGVDPAVNERNEVRRAYAVAALNRSQSLLASHDRNDSTGAELQDAVRTIDDGLSFVDVDTAPLHVGMLEHARGLVCMEAANAVDAREAFTRSLAVFTRSTFPFQHAVASFNRGRASHALGNLGNALLDYEAALQVFDPRLHRAQWAEAASRLADIEAVLRANDPLALRHDHVIGVLVASPTAERSHLLRERLTRMLGSAPMPQRTEFALYFGAVHRLSEHDEAASDALLRETIETLMELPEELLEGALHGWLDASSALSPVTREETDRRLDTAIQELLMPPQRMRLRDILYASGWERP